MLEIRDINVHFGVIQALKGISITVNDGEIVTLIGANGAGKTTTLHTSSGLKKPTSGTIHLDGKDITGASAQERVKLGISQVPEGRRIFSALTVLENLELGAYLRRGKSEIAQDLENVFVRFPRLAERKKQSAGTLSGGEQQMLAIARALVTGGDMILFDEPSMGLAPLIILEIFRIIKSLQQEGKTILLIEQNANMALGIADRAYVLENGRITISGPAAEIKANEEVRKAYLGA